MSAPAGTAAEERPAYRDANALRWLVGLFLSLLGDQVFFIALAWTATQVAPPSLAGLVVAAGAVPRAVLMLLGGALADRVGPRRTAIAGDGARTVVMLAVAGLLLLEQPSVAVLVVLALVFGVVDAVVVPAVGALPVHLVEGAELARLTAMRQAVTRATTVVGAPLAGWLVAAHGLPAVYAVCAGLFAASVVALALTRTRPVAGGAGGDGPDGAAGRVGGSRPGLLADVRDGLRHVRGHRLLLPLLVLSAVSELGFAGPVNVGLPLLADARGWGADGVGLLLGVWGGTAALTSVALTVLGPPRRTGLWGVLCLPVMGAALLAVPLAPGLPGAAGAAAVLGVGSGLVSPLLGGLVLAASEPAQVGRVMALSSLATLGGAPVAYAATGVVVDLLGPAAPFLLGGGSVVLTGSLGLLLRPVRRARADGAEGA